MPQFIPLQLSSEWGGDVYLGAWEPTDGQTLTQITDMAMEMVELLGVLEGYPVFLNLNYLF